MNPKVYDFAPNPLPITLPGKTYTYKTAIDAYVNRTGKTLSQGIYMLGEGASVFKGNVGIGTTNPERKLHVSGIDDVEQVIEAINDGFASLTLKSNNKRWHWSKRPSNEGDALRLFYHNGTNWLPPFMSVGTDGNVGVGTAWPSRRLHIVGSGTNVGQWLENTGT